LRNTWRRSACTDHQLLARLEADRETVAAMNIGNLEADIDEAVYNLFDLTDDEREVVEEYLTVF